MLTEATTASGMRRAISESGRYRYRARVRDEAQLAELERLRAALDARAGYGSLWTPERRERAAETARQAAARRRAARAPAAVPEPAPEPAPAPAPARCRACRYLTSSIGHRLACGS